VLKKLAPKNFCKDKFVTINKITIKMTFVIITILLFVCIRVLGSWYERKQKDMRIEKLEREIEDLKNKIP